jgi:hypothetical protein
VLNIHTPEPLAALETRFIICAVPDKNSPKINPQLRSRYVVVELGVSQ